MKVIAIQTKSPLCIEHSPRNINMNWIMIYNPFQFKLEFLRIENNLKYFSDQFLWESKQTGLSTTLFVVVESTFLCSTYTMSCVFTYWVFKGLCYYFHCFIRIRRIEFWWTKIAKHNHLVMASFLLVATFIPLAVLFLCCFLLPYVVMVNYLQHKNQNDLINIRSHLVTLFTVKNKGLRNLHKLS